LCRFPSMDVPTLRVLFDEAFDSAIADEINA
jgi:hypothetical protein